MHRLLPLAALGVIALLCLMGIVGANGPQQAEPPKKNLVTQKLEAAQHLLAAVARNDNTEVEKHAQELIRISKDLAWKTIRTERYEELGKEYRNELEYLVKSARFKNNQAMALGYVKTSLACFNCHDHVREVKIAGN